MRLVKGLIIIIVFNLLLMAVAYVGAQQDTDTDDDKRTPIDRYAIPNSLGVKFVIADRWDKTDLTFKILNCPRNLDCGGAQNAIRKAFADWAAVSALTFTESAGSADIELSFTLDDPEFGTEGDVLAFAYFPSDGGDIFFDDIEPWTLFDGGDTDFYVVALHEIGHAIGIDHSSDPTAVMYAFSGTASTLQRDDILAVQRLYGTPTTGGNDDDTTTPPDNPTPVPTLPTPEILPPIENDDDTVIDTGGELIEDFGYEEWIVYAESGETLTITMESDELDSYLILLAPDYSTVLAEDDDSLGDYNAVITYTFTESGEYIIVATTYDGWMSGNYQLNVYIDGYDFSDDDFDDTDTDDFDDTDYTGSYVFSVVNFSGDDVCGVFISSSYADDWGDSLVGDFLGDGGSVAIELPADDYDVLVYDCYEDGMVWEEYFVTLTSNLSYIINPDGGYISK